MSFAWNNKVVLLTGASSGIGAELARQMARGGARLGLLARRAEMLNTLAAELTSTGGEALVLAADVTDAAAMKAAADKLVARFGRIDVMIANAGVGGTTGGRELDAAAVARIININLIGAVNSAAAVIPQMLRQKSGHLVVISSLAGYRGLPKSGAYSASKAGVSAFYESLRLDLKRTGIEVGIIHPGFIKTPLTAGREAQMPWLMETADGAAKILRAIERRQKSYAFPWQLASLVRATMIMPIAFYDKIIGSRQYRE